MTNDLDVLIAASAAPEFYQQLIHAGARRVGSLLVGGSEWRLSDGTTLDVLESDAAWVPDAIQTPATAPDGFPIIRLPYLVLMKIIASRGIDIGDLTRMLGGAVEESLRQVRRVIGTHLPDAMEDLESMILLGRLEQSQANTRMTPEGGSG